MRSGIFLAAAAVTVLATLIAAPASAEDDRGDVIAVSPNQRTLQLSWRDAEDSLKGTINPDLLREGEPLKVSLMVGSYYGAPFAGPVTIALRPDGAQGSADTITVTPENGAWHATFTPKSDGPHVIDVSFRTTRLKVLHAKIPVERAKLPRTIAWALAGALVVIAVVVGGTRLWRKPSA